MFSLPSLIATGVLILVLLLPLALEIVAILIHARRLCRKPTARGSTMRRSKRRRTR